MLSDQSREEQKPETYNIDVATIHARNAWKGQCSLAINLMLGIAL